MIPSSFSEKTLPSPTAKNPIESASPVSEEKTCAVLKLDKNSFPLQPQPCDDPLDPLNWSKLQKNTILAIVMALYFLFTYITTTTVPSFPDIQTKFNITTTQVNWTVAIPSLGLSLGPLLWSSPSDILGRRPIFLLGTLLALASTIACAKARTFPGYMAARFFQGLGVSPAATVGLSIINDCFFEHERGEKIGLWVLAIDMGPYFGPLMGGFVYLVSFDWIQWLTAIFIGATFIAELLWLPETLYPRKYMQTLESHAHVPPSEKTPSATVTTLDTPRTKTLPFLNLKPIPSLKTPSLFSPLTRFLLTWPFPAISLSVCAFCFIWYWWIISVISMIPAAYAQYSPQIQGLLFIGLIVGTLLVEIFASGRLSDWIVLHRARSRSSSEKLPEDRLWLMYPGAVITGIGLIVWGISIDKQWHWMVGQVALALFGAGIQMGNAALSAYIVDCYPRQAMSIVTFYSVLLNFSAFANPFYIVPWVDAVGYSWTFATQGIITVGLSVPVFALLQKFGGNLRRWSGEPKWVNPEFDT